MFPDIFTIHGHFNKGIYVVFNAIDVLGIIHFHFVLETSAKNLRERVSKNPSLRAMKEIVKLMGVGLKSQVPHME